MAALHAFLGFGDHVVAQIIETELGVGSIGDVGSVSTLLMVTAHAVLNEAYLHAQEAIDAPHHLAVSLCQIVVNRDDMDVVARKGVQVARER